MIILSNPTLDQSGISSKLGFALLAEVCSYDERKGFPKPLRGT
jgi:hypothetical protein